MTHSANNNAEMLCPRILPALVIADDALLAAKVSAFLKPPPGFYLAVVDGPRLMRPDAKIEVTRRKNAAAKVNANYLVHVGLSSDAGTQLSRILPTSRTISINDNDDFIELTSSSQEALPTLRWNPQSIGTGLLKAHREGRLIEFDDQCPRESYLPSQTGHMIVCEAGEDLSEVIAANLAHAMGAGLVVVPEIEQADVDYVLDGYYSIYDKPDVPISIQLGELRKYLRDIFRSVPMTGVNAITFITRKIPAGIAFPEVPTTHLFSYPDIGIQIINGLAAEQPGTNGINVAVLVDPETTDAPEIEAAAKILPEKGIFVRGYRSAGATVTAVSEMIDLFPYDLLLFATHCGDAPGYRWTYEFTDSENIERVLVVDIALSVGQTEEPELLDVTQFFRFHSLDGVEWNDPKKKEKLYIGSAIKDFVEQKSQWEPTRREQIPRVAGSAVMKMYDHNILPISHSLACGGTPIILNNACVSWHELASRFMFADARAYIGTLIPITTTEAQEIVSKVISDYGKFPLPYALWCAQNDTYGSDLRRPYMIAGVYPQWIRTTPVDAPSLILQKLSNARDHWRRKSSEPEASDRLKRWTTYYEREIEGINQRWFSASS